MTVFHFLFIVGYLTVWTIVDLPFYIVGRIFGIGPDKAFHKPCR